MSTNNKQQIALFGGSFDPVHTDHLNIAIACHEQLGFDEVWFLPAFLNPFKPSQNSSVEDRLAMLHLVADEYDWIKINEFEIRQEKPSYTFNTVKHFLSNPDYKDKEFAFIMGSDQLDHFEQWDQFEALIKAIKFKVFKRSEDYNQEVVAKYHLEVFDFNRIGLSSTMIRNLEGLSEQIKSVNDYANYHLLYLPERLESQLDQSRYQHCLNVGLMAQELAKTHGFDENKALVAGTLHDITKRWDETKQRETLKLYAPDLMAEPEVVWHSFTAKFYLEYVWLIEDEAILDGVFNHTVGQPQMSQFAKLIFCADKISVERDYEGVEELRQLCFNDLDAGFVALLENQYENALAKHGPNGIGTMLQATYDYYVKEGKN